MDEPIDITVAGEHGGEECLWGDEGHTDGEELGLSAELRADLAAFGDRWERNVHPATWDDTWDHSFVMSTLVDLKWALHDARPSVWRERRREDREMRRIGEELAARVQAELGPRYRVTYRH